jgi:hypothetical protein
MMLKDLRRLAAHAAGRSGLIVTLVAAALGAATCHAQVINGDFSAPGVKGAGQFIAKDKISGWKTDDSHIEIWESGSKVGAGPTFNTPPGIKQFAEVNAHKHGTLSQEVAGIRKGSQYGFSFWHRGRHSPTDADVIEVSVAEGGKVVWKRAFSTTNAAWKQYTAAVGTKMGDGPVLLSFRAVSTASKDQTIGNFLTGVKLDASVKPPQCVQNAAGDYQWTTDNRKTTRGNGKLESVGVVKLNADQKAFSQVGTRVMRTGVWQITNECQVTINWGNGQFIDNLTLSNDGKVLSGVNQIGTIITGKK